jgi:hypothetical protein
MYDALADTTRYTIAIAYGRTYDIARHDLIRIGETGLDRRGPHSRAGMDGYPDGDEHVDRSSQTARMSSSGKPGCAPHRPYLVEDLEPF